MEQTLAIVKPDGVKRGLISDILKRYENKGLRLKATKIEDALPGTIRGDFASDTTYNIIHGSNSVESAKREILLCFPKLK
ncbi:MAG: nucleoside-diphosphate kinase [Thermoanaerobacteraceae bacterium]|nr:nucleoside-diphosphate kinase [Thermoanaerobacteraceae bacterium]